MINIDLNAQLSSIDKDLLKLYGAENLSINDPYDIAKARIIAEERELFLNLDKQHIFISENDYFEMRIDRRVEEKKIFLAGGESPLYPPPMLDRLPTRRRQTKDLWCYATTSMMLAQDSGFLKEKHRRALNSYQPVLYDTDPKLRHKYCGYDLKRNKYYCDPAQEYTVALYGDSPKSCFPGDVQRSTMNLTGKSMKRIGNGYNSYWLNSDGSLNMNKQKKLAETLKIPAIFDGFLNGDPSTGKGHSFLINGFFFDGEKIYLHTEECVYGERAIITDFSKYIDCSVFEFRIKLTNIYYFD